MNQFTEVLCVAAILAVAMFVSTAMAEDAADGPRQLDRLELDTSAITGNQELPKVLYIVPWKDSSLGALNGKPVNSLLNEVLSPLDREVFKRQVKYFDQLYAADTVAAAESEAVSEE